MRLLRVELDRFRNLKKQTVELHPRYNLLVGDNGQGKTNFLEAVGYLGTLRSFRNAATAEMIQQSEEMCRVAGRVRSRGVDHDLAFVLTARGRSQFLDERKVLSPEKYLQALKVISFVPEDVGLVSGSPSWRRRTLDRAVFEAVPGYVREYRKYLAVLRQRNALLRSRGPLTGELAGWSRGLAEAGAVLIRRRGDLLHELAPHLAGLGASFGLGSSLGLAYRLSFDGLGDSWVAGSDRSQIETALAAAIENAVPRERTAGHTLIGPHRDNVLFTLNGRDLGRFGSQGQKRSAVLAFKLATAAGLAGIRGGHPLVLLDDVASELDADRRQALAALVREEGGQFFVTATSQDRGFLEREEGFVFEVRDGGVSRLA